MRGNGWHIMNMQAVSANQMLQMVEFGYVNGQNALESGITYKPNNNSDILFVTGSTASLGNASGNANITTTIDNNDASVTYSDEGHRAISYRGFEDPWGNMWNMLGGAKIIGDGTSSGTLYLCNDFNYDLTVDTSNYHGFSFTLPPVRNWLRTFGYDSEEYDWVYLPIETSAQANSLIPIGDNIWVKNNLNGVYMLSHGGAFGLQEECGPFYYAADQLPSA